MNNGLIIFTRNPELGKVKTRLAKDIGDRNALAVYNDLLLFTKQLTENIKVDKLVYYSDKVLTEDLWSEQYIKREQQGEDLGVRMQMACKESFEMGFEKVILIGSDLLDITPKHIMEAYENLDRNDLVIGPAKDGGYYLLGMKTCHDFLFQEKEWGASSVLKDTINDLNNHRLSYHLLQELNDIDIVEDLKKYPNFEKYWKKF